MIKTVDNFNSNNINLNKTNSGFSFGVDKYYFKSSAQVNKESYVFLKDYKDKSSNNIFFSFFKDEDKRNSKNEDDLIISIKKDGDSYIAQTGNYVGQFVWDGLHIDIKSRFSNIFLERMLNFANDVYLDDVSVSGTTTNKELDISKFIIYYMFVQNLEKAFLLGLPKSYRSINHHDMKLKGKIDINRFIKRDIPFQGKISSVSREQKEIQEIIDILHKAIKIIDKNDFNTKNISHIKTHLKQHRSNNFVSNATINKAMSSKALQNPIFTPYKKVLEYARYIINGDNLEQKSNESKETYGFLINVAELFEIYVTKLLSKEFPEWSITSPKIELYENQFYKRKIIPDIVMTNNITNETMVFDTKYKRMKFRDRYQGADVDRNDFFQINTYMSYYQNSGYKVIAGGLLYPMEGNFEQNNCYSDSWFGNSDTKFIIDGIDLSNKDLTMDDIKESEEAFVKRIEEISRKQT
jgi:5-methylcytosine-specific restriction endonuclease McrBC regulatory subunit McrC